MDPMTPPPLHNYVICEWSLMISFLFVLNWMSPTNSGFERAIGDPKSDVWKNINYVN